MFTMKQVQEKMDTIIKKKTEDFDTIERLSTAASTALEAATAEREAAAAEMDSKRFEAAEKAQADAKRRLDMIAVRQKQLAGQDYITETESDQYVDSILAHERQISEAFEADAGKLLQQLDALHKTYTAEIAAAEEVLHQWTANVHANFRSFGMTTFRETGTHRSPRPIPVPGHGPERSWSCDAARAIRNALDGDLREYRRSTDEP